MMKMFFSPQKRFKKALERKNYSGAERAIMKIKPSERVKFAKLLIDKYIDERAYSRLYDFLLELSSLSAFLYAGRKLRKKGVISPILFLAEKKIEEMDKREAIFFTLPRKLKEKISLSLADEAISHYDTLLFEEALQYLPKKMRERMIEKAISLVGESFVRALNGKAKAVVNEVIGRRKIEKQISEMIELAGRVGADIGGFLICGALKLLDESPLEKTKKSKYAIRIANFFLQVGDMEKLLAVMERDYFPQEAKASIFQLAIFCFGEEFIEKAKELGVEIEQTLPFQGILLVPVLNDSYTSSIADWRKEDSSS